MGRNANQRAAWAELIGASDPEGVLYSLDHEAGVAVAFARHYSDVRRAIWEAELAEDEH